jgi:hypothetical protein
VGTCLFAKVLLDNGCVYLLLRMCYLAVDVVSSFVSWSLPSNGCTRYNMNFFWSRMFSSNIYRPCPYLKHLRRAYMCKSKTVSLVLCWFRYKWAVIVIFQRISSLIIMRLEGPEDDHHMYGLVKDQKSQHALRKFPGPYSVKRVRCTNTKCFLPSLSFTRPLPFRYSLTFLI